MNALLKSVVNRLENVVSYYQQQFYLSNTLTSNWLKFHTNVEVNSARLFENVFNKCSRVLNLVFSRNSNFHEQGRICCKVAP